MRKLTPFIPAILSAMLLTGCANTRIVTVERTVVPEITFPVFPLAEKMIDNNNGTVSVPSEWLIRLEEYHIRIEETESIYTEIYKLHSEK